MEPIITIFILIYLLTLLISAIELVPLSVASLTGALLTVWFGIQYGVFTYEEAFAFIDFRLLALIIGTMIVVEVAERSGLFRVAALYAVKFSGGSPGLLFVFLCITSALVSMFLSDSTAMLLMAAAIITISKLLGYEPTPYFLAATIMINLGGTSTLIGSVSNMIIGIEAGMGFSDFVSYLTLCEIALWALTTLTLYWMFKSKLGEKKKLPEYEPMESITNRQLFYRSLFILFLLISLFLVLEQLGIGPEAVALGCAILALILSKLDPSEIFKDMDWETIFFIAGFMVIVGGLEKSGVLEILSNQLFTTFGQNSLSATVATLWVSGIASTVVSNIAIALTFAPIIKAHLYASLNIPALWSALVLGTNLGGATTPFSGAVCMMAIGALKREGITVHFGDFTKAGVITSLVQLSFSTLYLILRFGLIG
ncbi:anion permease [Candidatus Bathyarchaeota archaeon]|nr:anion permease [Candidatus Bathyarchaeota archaeon]